MEVLEEKVTQEVPGIDIRRAYRTGGQIDHMTVPIGKILSHLGNPSAPIYLRDRFGSLNLDLNQHLPVAAGKHEVHYAISKALLRLGRGGPKSALDTAIRNDVPDKGPPESSIGLDEVGKNFRCEVLYAFFCGVLAVGG